MISVRPWRHGVPAGISVALVTMMRSVVAATTSAAGVASPRSNGTSSPRQWPGVPCAMSSADSGAPATRANQYVSPPGDTAQPKAVAPPLTMVKRPVSATGGASLA